ncbi:hypothetical protein CMALT394_210102 [Carnobacterium maltaromaticum]|nr:hypothetical protein CMALT394_210102 [Carnobacterium maltaromaticum]
MNRVLFSDIVKSDIVEFSLCNYIIVFIRTVYIYSLIYYKVRLSYEYKIAK